MGGLGKKGEVTMYDWIKDKKFLGMMHSRCAEIVNWLVQDINKSGFMKVKQHLVGSGAKNLILQNEHEPIDLDYNLEIIDCEDYEDCKRIKELVMDTFNGFLPDQDWGYCKDSTSAITTERIHFEGYEDIQFSIDVAITCKDTDGNWWRLVNKKTGIYQNDSWVWEQAPASKGLEKRVEKLKKNSKYWQEVRNRYKEKKNMYLGRPDEKENHPSFNVYIETINEIYYNHFKGV